MTTPAKPYQPSQSERDAVGRYFEDRDNKPTLPKLSTEVVDGVGQISVDHPDPATGFMLLQSAMGTTNSEFFDGLITQMLNAGGAGQGAKDNNLNFMLSVVADIQPKDHLEAMLATQMAAVHMATMTFSRRLASVETIPQQDSAERALNKLARTFATQMEALKKYRTGGEQKMTVEHVTVNEGGQAIVGNVSQGDRGRAQNPKATP